jgi:hypothetical protein
MEKCYHREALNCAREHICDDGYECCSQKVPDGSKPTLGLCVKSGTCDPERGICTDKNKNLLTSITEKFVVFSKESYKNINTFNKLVLIISIILLIILILTLIYSLKTKMKT